MRGRCARGRWRVCEGRGGKWCASFGWRRGIDLKMHLAIDGGEEKTEATFGVGLPSFAARLARRLRKLVAILLHTLRVPTRRRRGKRRKFCG